MNITLIITTNPYLCVSGSGRHKGYLTTRNGVPILVGQFAAQIQFRCDRLQIVRNDDPGIAHDVRIDYGQRCRKVVPPVVGGHLGRIDYALLDL